MDDAAKQQHNEDTSRYHQGVALKSGEGLIMSALAILILNGRKSKYDLEPEQAAVVYELLHRADPSFDW